MFVGGTASITVARQDAAMSRLRSTVSRGRRYAREVGYAKRVGKREVADSTANCESQSCDSSSGGRR